MGFFSLIDLSTIFSPNLVISVFMFLVFLAVLSSDFK